MPSSAHGRRVGAGVRRDDRRVAQVRRGGRGRGELRRELAERRCWLRCSMRPKVGGVPEGRGPAVAEQDLVAVGQGEQLGQAVAQAPDHELDGRLAVAGAQVVGPGRRQRVDGLGADLGRPAAEPAVRPGGGRSGMRDVWGWRRSRPVHYRGGIPRRTNPLPSERLSHAAVTAIAPSATLAVDAKAKALKAAGEDVIGFGAGEPDFPTPDHIVEAAVEAAARTPPTTTTRPTPGLPELRQAIAAKTHAGLGLRGQPQPGRGHQRRQAGRLRGHRVAHQPGRRGPPPRAVLDDLSRADRARRRRPVVLPTDEAAGFRVTVDQLEAARTERTKALVFVSPVEPDRRGVPAGRGRGHRPLGRRARHLGHHRRDLRAPHLRRQRVQLAARPSCPRRPTRPSSSTAWPRPTP